MASETQSFLKSFKTEAPISRCRLIAVLSGSQDPNEPMMNVSTSTSVHPSRLALQDLVVPGPALGQLLLDRSNAPGFLRLLLHLEQVVFIEGLPDLLTTD